MKVVGLAVAALVAARTPSDLPHLRYSPEELERADTRVLATKLFGVEGQVFTESTSTRVDGVAQWRGINVRFASFARASGYDGLCAFEGAEAYFGWRRSEQPSASDVVELVSAHRSVWYGVLSSTPTLNKTTGDGERCRQLAPLSNKSPPHDIKIDVDGKPASVDQAAFAVRALVIAKHLAQPARRFDLTRVYSINVAPCGEDGTVRPCVRGWIEDGLRGVELNVRLGALPERGWGDVKPAVRSASFVVHDWPVL